MRDLGEIGISSAWRYECVERTHATQRPATPQSLSHCAFLSLLASSQDPFELSHDLGRVMDRDTLRDVRSEIDRADVLLSEQRGNFAKLTLKFEEKKEQTRPEKQAKEAKAYKEKKEAKEADAAQAIAEQAVADLLLE